MALDQAFAEKLSHLKAKTLEWLLLIILRMMEPTFDELVGPTADQMSHFIIEEDQSGNLLIKHDGRPVGEVKIVFQGATAFVRASLFGVPLTDMDF